MAAQPSDGYSTMINKRYKRVTISDYSRLAMYTKDPEYQAIKAYKSKETEDFKVQAKNEGLRIQALVSSLPCGTGTAMEFLIRRGYLAHEELLGIEHFVVKRDVATKVVDERKAHVLLVLFVQKQLREQSGGSTSDNAAVLASAAVANSKKHVEKAKLRARLAR